MIEAIVEDLSAKRALFRETGAAGGARCGAGNEYIVPVGDRSRRRMCATRSALPACIFLILRR